MRNTQLQPAFIERLTAITSELGVGAAHAVTELAGGANNQVYRFETPTRSLVAKRYYRHPNDPRDRLAAEWSFVSFAWNNGLKTVPEPIASDPCSGIAIYEFIEGKKLASREVDESAVHATIQFCQRLRVLSRLADAAELPPGSESCFTTNEHLHCVERRIQRLKTTLTLSSEIDRQALDFIETDLTQTAEDVLQNALQDAKSVGLNPDDTLPKSQRLVSPSDFGFHNALRDARGNIRFIDFEYAGWDDPAKLVCDFFCQPQRPVPMKYYSGFSRTMAGESSESERELRRTSLLLPVYRLKWCCIMLNDFLETDGQRRRFATRSDESQRKTEQLMKARQALKLLREEQARQQAA
jgi:hypothetical protein